MSDESGQQPQEQPGQTPPAEPAQPQFNPQTGFPVGDTPQPPQPPPYPTPGAGNPYGGPTQPYPQGQPPYPPQYPPQYQGQYPPQYQGQPGIPPFPVYVRPDHPKSTSALVVGIISVAGLFICGLPILASPVAWVLGAQARRDIRNEPQRWGGEGKATAGMVLGIIGTVLLALIIVAIVVLVIVAVNDPTAFDSDTGV